MIMVIKINYNIVAFLLSIVFVIAVFAVDYSISAGAGSAEKTTAAQADEDVVDLPVLMYHHLSTSASRIGDYVISPEQFENDLKHIKQGGYQTITGKQLIAFLENGAALPPKPILITFDDGYESVYAYAFPLLKKYEMCAVMSIIGKHTDIFSNPDEPRGINYSHASWNQLREMQESGIFEIGNHSYDMHSNAKGKRFGIRINPGEGEADYRQALLKDIGELSDMFEKELGDRPDIFAYPFGALCKESKPILTELGFKLILTCEEKVNHLSPNMSLPVSIKRFNRSGKYSAYEYFSKFESQ